MGQTMKAAVKVKAAPDSTEVKQVPVPEITDDEVLMRVKIASICGTDVHIYEWDAWSQGRIKVPLIQGHEMAGEVEEVGKDVTHVDVGDYVSAEGHIACGHCYQCRNGQAHVCANVRILGIDRDGSFAEYIAIPESNVIRNDPGLPPEIATIQDPLGNAVYTVDNADVAGKVVAVFGLGPIGLMAVAVCRALSAARVIAVGHRNEYRMDLARKIGAHDVLRSNEHTVQEILDRTSGEGVEEALEFSGSGQALNQAVKAVRSGGGVHMLGIFRGPVTLDLARDVVMRGVSMHGIAGRRMYQTWTRMGGILKSGNLDLRPILTHRFPLDDYVEAMEVMRSGNCGKVAFPME